MIPQDPALRRVGRLWAAYQARDWALARAQLAPDAVCRWWATGELFEGADAVIRVNAEYPEGWAIFLLELEALGRDQVLSLVRVEQGGQSFWTNSRFRLGAAGIQSIDEYWCDQAQAPVWRAGLARSMGKDGRPGLSLDLSAWA